MKGLRLSPSLLVAIAALAVALGGAAYAAIPDNGVIHGCYDSGGNLKVIDMGAGQTCGKGYTSLSWSQTGPQGPPGPQGSSGAISGALDLPAANTSDPSQLPWTTLLSIPGIAQVQMACSQNELAYVKLVNMSSGRLLAGSHAVASLYNPGDSFIFDQGVSLPSSPSTDVFLVHVQGGSQVASISIGDVAATTNVGGVPPEPAGCHGFAEAIVQSAGG
jgi:hypothetical protein